MFYSHQLLARKAPLGQIWMAATMHAKINRRKLDKLNIINICEEILNPSVPMALRLSGILMGGVVIVYERKVKLLYEDVTRLLVEINAAWKVKSVLDPTVLPKGKSQAKYEAVTLPENQEAELGEIERLLHCSNSNTSYTIMGFQQTAFIAMRLDNVDEPYISHNPREEDLPQHYHQADAANITLCERFDSYQADTGGFNRFERFDIEGDDDEPPMNFARQAHTEIPSTLIPSPPLPEAPQPSDEIPEQHPEDHANQKSEEGKETIQDQQRQRAPRRKARKLPASLMDYEQTIIPGQMYQSWLQNASDIVSRRGRKRKHLGTKPSMKIAKLMELPPVGLICGLFANQESYYPAPLLKLWMRSTQPPQDCPSGRTSPAQPPEPSSSSPPERPHLHDPPAYFEDFHSGVGSQSLGVSIEKQRANVDNYSRPVEILTEELRSNLMNNGVRANETDRVTGTEANVMVTPGNSGDEVRSIPSSGSGHGFVSHNSEANSIRSNKKRIFSSAKHSGSGLEPVAEENSWHHPDPKFKLARLSETGVTPENDLMVETGPTQTQHNPIIDQPMDQITDSIRMHLKMHFDTPGAGQAESLSQLAMGMNRKRAACLFYQICVLATRDFVRVVQRMPYGDILISKGEKM